MNKWLEIQARKLVDRAETKYGQRAHGWSAIKVIESLQGPLLDCTSTKDILYITLLKGSAANRDQALFQLSHEAIHVLGPVTSPPATILEEGLAVWFSLYEPKYKDKSYVEKAITWMNTDPEGREFEYALGCYNELIKIEPFAIRKLRLVDPYLDNLTDALIQTRLPKVSQELAQRLADRRTMRPRRLPGNAS